MSNSVKTKDAWVIGPPLNELSIRMSKNVYRNTRRHIPEDSTDTRVRTSDITNNNFINFSARFENISSPKCRRVLRPSTSIFGKLDLNSGNLLQVECGLEQNTI
jgi:hypothetical protein